MTAAPDEPRPAADEPRPGPPPRFVVNWPAFLGGWCGLMSWPTSSLLWDAVRLKLPPPDLDALPAALAITWAAGWVPGGFGAAAAAAARRRRGDDWPLRATHAAGAFVAAFATAVTLFLAAVALFLLTR